MMVMCAPGNDGCLMMSVLSCWPSCSFGTLSWPPRQRRSCPRCWSWKTNRNSVTRSRPNCGRYVPTGRCPSMRDGDGSWMCSSRTLMTSPCGSNAAAGGRPPISRSPCCLGLYGCRQDTEEDMLLVRMGLPGAVDDLARMVYKKVKPLHLLLPSLADECPEWEWYEEN